MNDPHVSAIRYHLELGKGYDYVPPTDGQSFTLGDFDFTIKGSDITVKPRIHFADRDSVRAAVEPHIRAWELEAGIRLHIPRLQIVYQGTDVIDRAPTQGVNELNVESITSAMTSDNVILIQRIAEHPPPADRDFTITPDVETMWQRYVGYLEGREPLLSMAYFCYTFLAPGKKGHIMASKRLNTEKEVFKKLSELSSTRGDALSGRKANLPHLTSEEYGWVDQTVRALIIQLAKSTSGPSADRLKMTDLPNL